MNRHRNLVMSDYEPIDFLEQRISALELLVFGTAEKDADYPRTAKTKIHCIESLLEIQGKIGTALSGKKKAALLYEKLPELRMYLDHAYTDEMLLSEDARAEIVLTEADFLERETSLLKLLSENQGHMNSEHIQSVPKHVEKLQTLSKIQLEQQDEVSQLTDETRKMLNAYDSVVALLSKQFIMWDEILTQLEMQAKTQK